MLHYLINQHQFSPEVALKASSSIPVLKNPENSDPILSFLKDRGFSKSHIEEILKKKPKILCSSLDNTIKPKLGILHDLGLSQDEIAYIVALKVSAWFLNLDNLEKNMIPNIEFLRGCGISSLELINSAYSFPRVLFNKPERIREFFNRVDELRVTRESKMYLYAIRMLSSMSMVNLENKLKLFRSLDFRKIKFNVRLGGRLMFLLYLRPRLRRLV
ncbi:hypothetical protein SLA2020_115530 [Shorea laevis]